MKLGRMSDTGRKKIFCGTQKGGPAIVKKPLMEKWITTLECICATGGLIKPLLIFAAKPLWTTWFCKDILDEEMKD